METWRHGCRGEVCTQPSPSQRCQKKSTREKTAAHGGDCQVSHREKAEPMNRHIHQWTPWERGGILDGNGLSGRRNVTGEVCCLLRTGRDNRRKDRVFDLGRIEIIGHFGNEWGVGIPGDRVARPPIASRRPAQRPRLLLGDRFQVGPTATPTQSVILIVHLALCFSRCFINSESEWNPNRCPNTSTPSPPAHLSPRPQAARYAVLRPASSPRR